MFQDGMWSKVHKFDVYILVLISGQVKAHMTLK